VKNSEVLYKASVYMRDSHGFSPYAANCFIARICQAGGYDASWDWAQTKRILRDVIGVDFYSAAELERAGWTFGREVTQDASAALMIAGDLEAAAGR
jgi:hypothetical protein